MLVVPKVPGLYTEPKKRREKGEEFSWRAYLGNEDMAKLMLPPCGPVWKRCFSRMNKRWGVANRSLVTFLTLFPHSFLLDVEVL